MWISRILNLTCLLPPTKQLCHIYNNKTIWNKHYKHVMHCCYGDSQKSWTWTWKYNQTIHKPACLSQFHKEPPGIMSSISKAKCDHILWFKKKKKKKNQHLELTKKLLGQHYINVTYNKATIKWGIAGNSPLLWSSSR